MTAHRVSWLLAATVTVVVVAATRTAPAVAAGDMGAEAAGALSRLVMSAHTHVGVPVTATVERQAGNTTRVELRSSNTSVVTVPTHIWIQRGAASAQFEVTAVNGPGGCARVTATDPDNSVFAKIFTYPRAARLPGTMQLQMNPGSTWNRPEYDATVYGVTTVKGVISGDGATGRTWTLESSSPAVSVPRTVPAAPGATSVEFTATVRGAADCTLITASDGRTSLRRLLVFVDVGG
jgi:hypothetical protein